MNIQAFCGHSALNMEKMQCAICEKPFNEIVLEFHKLSGYPIVSREEILKKVKL